MSAWHTHLPALATACETAAADGLASNGNRGGTYLAMKARKFSHGWPNSKNVRESWRDVIA